MDTTPARLSPADIRRVAATLDVTSFVSYRDYLKALYGACHAEAGSYSYSQFARDLGFSFSNVLWLVCTGRRKLTPTTTQRLIEAAGLSGNARRYLQTLVAYNNARRSDVREARFKQLLTLKSRGLTAQEAIDTLEYFAEWQHPVVREMTALPDFRSEPDWIASRLAFRLLPAEVKRSLELLEQLGLVRFDPKMQRHVQTGGQILPDRNVETMAQIRYHQKMSELARDALTITEARRREMNTMTICVDEETAMKMGEMLYRTCEEIMKLEAKCTKRTQVYQVNVQLFPLTKG